MLLRALPIYCTVSLALGCVEIEHPLSEIAEEVRADDFAGEWYLIDPHFGVDREPMRIVASSTGGCEIPEECRMNEDGTLTTKLIAVAGWKFIEVKLTPNSSADADGTMSFLVSIERRGDWLAARQLDDEAIEQFIENGELDGKVVKGIFSDSVTITAPPKELAEFLFAHREDVFEGRYNLYRRKSAEFPTPADLQ